MLKDEEILQMMRETLELNEMRKRLSKATEELRQATERQRAKFPDAR